MIYEKNTQRMSVVKNKYAGTKAAFALLMAAYVFLSCFDPLVPTSESAAQWVFLESPITNLLVGVMIPALIYALCLLMDRYVLQLIAGTIALSSGMGLPLWVSLMNVLADSIVYVMAPEHALTRQKLSQAGWAQAILAWGLFLGIIVYIIIRKRKEKMAAAVGEGDETIK